MLFMHLAAANESDSAAATHGMAFAVLCVTTFVRLDVLCKCTVIGCNLERYGSLAMCSARGNAVQNDAGECKL